MLNRDSYTNDLVVLCRGLFSTVLKDAAGDAANWPNYLKDLERHALLSYRVPSIFKATPYEIDNEKLEDPRYRRTVIRKLKAPRPSKWMSVRLQLDRERLLNDPSYLNGVAELMGEKWGNRLATDDHADLLVLFKHLDAALIDWCIRNLMLSGVSADAIATFILRRMAYELIDKNETFKRVMAEMKAKTSAIVAEFNAAVRAIAAEHIEESRRSFDAISREVIGKH